MESTTNRALLLPRLLLMTIVADISFAWNLEARPSLKYTTQGGSPTITCYNVTGSTEVLPRDSRWYKITSNGALQQISTDRNERVRSDGSQLRISSAREEDNGTYCCKGPTQPLDTCDETATAYLIVVVPPVITPGQNQTAHVGRNAIVQCYIENVGNPPFAVFRWQKSAQRLVTDGTKYISQLIGGNIMVLTIINSTTEDEGYYRCIVETAVFQRREASVFLAVNDSVTHMGSNDVSVYDTDYALRLHGQDEISVGMGLVIQCMIVTLAGNPIENMDMQLTLVLPTGEVIIGREFNTIATLKHNGTYSCIAYLNGAPTVVILPVFVYAAPQPVFHRNSVSASFGCNVSLPCTVHSANPSPSYNWEKLSVEDASSEINGRILSNGSLVLQNVQKSGVYQCTAHNVYGSSTQLTELRVHHEMFNTTYTTQSISLVGTNLRSSCDQVEHGIKLSSLLEQHITNICNCGDIIITTDVTSCTDNSVVYNIYLTGIMATDAALLLVTSMQNLTEGLDVGIVVLFLQKQGKNFESHCNDENDDIPSEIFGVIGVLTAIITMLLIFALISVIYFRKRVTSESRKFNIEAVNATYITANSPPPLYNRLQHSNTAPPAVPIRRSGSESSLTSYMQVYPKCPLNNIKPYLQLPSPNNQTTKSATVLHNAATNSSTSNNNPNANRSKACNCDVDVAPSTTYPSYVCIKNNKI